MLTIKQEEFEELKQFIYKNYGIDLTKKKHLIEGRLGNSLAARGFSSFREYFEYVYNDKSGAELSELLNRLTTNHTYFMRENAHFEYYKNTVLPELFNTVSDKSLGIWSAGCSTGEEPSTLAMLNDEFFYGKIGWDTRILATDISDRVLEIAKKGVYSAEAVEKFPQEYRKKYMKPCENGYMFLDRIRDNIIYKKFNLMDEFRFKRKFHVIFCRNVMIYFDSKTKLELVNKFYEVTEKGGYLFIGHSEYLDKDAIEYDYVMPAVYKKG
ncbi:MAG: protein-glutamate O-methyltransferase CheR [Clostridia bacterium]|nr:protein-glutamate O-methyltransferase CheR [Clostridia bacterium]